MSEAHAELIKTLYTNRLMQSRDQVIAFEEALNAISENLDPEDLPDLLLVFDDACEHHEVMWGLLHFVENFEMENELHALTQTIDRMIDRAHEWIEIFHYRILNTERCRLYYRQLLSALPETNYHIIRQVLEGIAAEDPDFKTRVDYILSK